MVTSITIHSSLCLVSRRPGCIQNRLVHMVLYVDTWMCTACLSQHLSLTLLQATRCSLTHFPDVLVHSVSACTVADLQLLQQGAWAEITLLYWRLMRHSDNHVSIYCEPLLFNMFCLLPTTASISMWRADWNHIKSETKHHWFPLLNLITVVLIGILGRHTQYSQAQINSQLCKYRNNIRMHLSWWFSFLLPNLPYCNSLILLATSDIMTCHQFSYRASFYWHFAYTI